ncbi:MAG: PadR family transcriptional regulator [Candidatus Eisenbacteria bacterium]|nr:PadR family transcriptional regulator [Candidatus Eisenbacteria bacterium]
MKVPGRNEMAALGLVGREPMHGYRINQIVQQMGLEHWANLSPSSIYNTLGRLAKKGAVSVTTEREGKAPERTVYHITDRGRDLLQEHLRASLVYVGPEDRLFYVAVSFMESLPEEEIAALLEERIRRIETLIEDEQKCTSDPGMPPHIVLMCEAGMFHFRVEIDVCRRLIDLMRGRPRYFEETGGRSDESR